jgi:hypothetical protein
VQSQDIGLSGNTNETPQSSEPSDAGSQSPIQRFRSCIRNMSTLAQVAVVFVAVLVCILAVAVTIAAATATALALPHIAIAGAAVGVIVLAGLAVKYAVDHHSSVVKDDCDPCENDNDTTMTVDIDIDDIFESAVQPFIYE